MKVVPQHVFRMSAQISLFGIPRCPIETERAPLLAHSDVKAVASLNTTFQFPFGEAGF